ncbi:MAG: hypothetical protein KY459_15510 [Acidobacteria bacterium]|nr:hypothetical protein [Acidobacteriota bacterium]
MVLFNYATKEITAKIVYYGPGLCGKTTNLQFIYDSLPSNSKSKMLSLATKTDRTLFFDFLPLDLGTIRGMRTKLQLYTVPGQVYYNSTRQLVLKGADGVVFVVDSQDFALDANIESLENLDENLRKQGLRLKELPLVMQYNKRDLPNVLPVDTLEEKVNELGVPSFESVAISGLGVEETLKGITQRVLDSLGKKYGLSSKEAVKDLQMLNREGTPEPSDQPSDDVWDDDVLVTEVATPGSDREEISVESGEDESIPLVRTEPAGDRPFNASFAELQIPGELPAPVPMDSVEIPLPDQILSSIPSATPPLASSAERRQADGLSREVTVPLNLTLDEIRRHRKLKLRITLDVNILK